MVRVSHGNTKKKLFFSFWYRHTRMLINTNINIKQQKIVKLNRDGRVKKYTNKNSKNNSAQDASLHPYFLFSSNRVPTKKHVGMQLLLILIC